MPDSRFFKTTSALGLAEIENISGAKASVLAPELVFTSVASLNGAKADKVAYFSDRRYLSLLKDCTAGAVFVKSENIDDLPSCAIALVTKFPQASWARLAARLHPLHLHDGSDVIHPSVQCEDDVTLGPGVVMAQDVEIGRGTYIGANTVIGPGVRIGRYCVIGAHSSLFCAYLGDRVKVSSGVRIGESGFGVSGDSHGLVDVPQLGRAIIQDDVSIGANTCIDRGAYADTIIGEGTKIDNMVQIAHNVVMGRNCIVAAHTGIAGSVRIGDGAMFGGRAGVVDHITVGKGARISAATVVLQDVAEGASVSGYPARPSKQFLREMIWLGKNITKKEKG